MTASEFSNIKWITTNINSSARQAHWTFTRRVNQEETFHNYIFTSTGLEQNIMTNLHYKPLLWHQNMTCGAPISNLEESLPFTSEKMAVCSVLKQVSVISHLMGHTRIHFMQLNLANCKHIAVHWWLHEACERASEAILRRKDLLQNPISQVQELNVRHCTNPAIPWGQLGLTIVSLLCTHKKFIKLMHLYSTCMHTYM